MTERFYSGREDHVSIREGQQLLPLNARLDLDPEGQTVLKWGRANSKGKRLAIALLADALSDDRVAVDLAEAFTARVVAMLPERWTMSRTRILSFVEIIKREYLGTPARHALNRASYDQARTDYGER
jgi:hypothetical protein